MLKLIINSTASVVEMNTFRKIILLLGLGCHRINDNNLAIMDKPKYEDGFWAPVDESQGYKRITTLTVGAGVYSRCLYTEIDPGYNMKGVLGLSASWMELMDFADTLWLIAKTLNPEFTVSDSGFLGHGRQQEHKISECFAELQKLSEQYNAQTDEQKQEESKLNSFFAAVELV